MKYEVKFTTQFKKDLKLAKKQNKDIDVLFSVIEQLAQGKQLDEKYRDHDLGGTYKGMKQEMMYLFFFCIVWAAIPNYFSSMSNIADACTCLTCDILIA